MINEKFADKVARTGTYDTPMYRYKCVERTSGCLVIRVPKDLLGLIESLNKWEIVYKF